MGIKFNCPNGHKLNVKSFLAGRRGICPHCEARFRIPLESGGQAEPVGKNEPQDDTRLTPAMQDDAAPMASSLASGNPIAGGTVATARGVGNSAAGQQGVPTAHAGAVAGSGMVDPITEAPHASWYVRPRSGGQYGPAVGELLRTWMTEGRVAGDSLVWREGWADWRQASSVFPQLAGAGPIPGALASGGLPTGGLPSGGLPTGGLPTGGLPAGGLPTGGLPTGSVASGAPLGGLSLPSTAPAPSSLTRHAATRRRSSNLTALLVMLLVFVAIALAAIFAWVLFGQDEVAQALPGHVSTSVEMLAKVSQVREFP